MVARALACAGGRGELPGDPPDRLAQALFSAWLAGSAAFVLPAQGGAIAPEFCLAELQGSAMPPAPRDAFVP